MILGGNGNGCANPVCQYICEFRIAFHAFVILTSLCQTEVNLSDGLDGLASSVTSFCGSRVHSRCI